MTEKDEFRAGIRDWIEANCPVEMRAPMSDADICWGGRKFTFASDAQERWMRACAGRGFTVPMWPKEYGGAGLSADEARVLAEEMKRINARPPLQSFGIWMLGHAMLAFGSEEQKRTYLPPIARGEIRWAQGYSEPGAGSDLASLQTRGEDKGDYFEVTGQKIWTSYANEADWIFALVRTEPEAPKHKGISFLLFDMESEGVSTRPIRLISGAAPFCETFFEGVKVPKTQIVGQRGEGWTIAKYLLTHEREKIGDLFSAGGGPLDPLTLAPASIGLDGNGQLADGLLRADLGRFLVDEMAFTAHLDAAKAHMRAGNQLGARSAEIKYLGTELNKRRLSLAVQAGGLEALDWREEDAPALAQSWLRTKGNSIEGGTSEVMLGIIAKALLGLPG
jgi:acyl-CoA dehydrogenase